MHGGVLARVPLQAHGSHSRIAVVEALERGERPDAVMASIGRALFWKDKDAVGAMLGKWPADDLATVADRVGRLERELMFSPAPEREALGEELLAIARKARSL